MRPAALLSALSTISLGLAAPATAQTPPDALVWMVLHDINVTGLDRDTPMNRPPIVTQVPEGMIRAVDLSPDGQVDWLIDYSAAGLSQFCGTGGCRLVIYASHEGDYQRAFDSQVLGFDIARRGGRQRLEAQVHHGACVPDDWECRYAWYWNQTTARMEPMATDAGRTLLPDGGRQPIDREPDERAAMAPASVQMTVAASRIFCPYEDLSLGGQLLEADLKPLPDLNGDGEDDWLVFPPVPCDADGPPDSEVHLSQANGDPVQAVTVDAATAISVDIARSPAFLVLDRDRMRWEPSRRSFVPEE